jgi:hypothetical protein
MDNLKDKSKQELEEYIELQYNNLASANKRISELEAETDLLRKQNGFTRITSTIKTPEELLCELEISKLYAEAQNRTLTPAETKQLEIYIKSLYLCKDKSKKPTPKDIPNEEVNTIELIKYALLSDN